MPSQSLPIFVINLDRRPERLAHMSAQLDALGLEWERVAALDAETASEADLAPEIALDRLLLSMRPGSQCCAITNFRIWRKLVDSDAPAAIILQDDIELSPDMVRLAQNLDWLPQGVELVQFEHYPVRPSTKVMGPALSELPGRRAVRQLFSRTGGAGAYLITREAARHALATKGKVRVPIDHVLFNPALSKLARHFRIGLVTPALAVQKKAQFKSDIALHKHVRTWRYRLVRGLSEISQIPRMAWLLVTGRAELVKFGYRAD